jgi:hypothetical protein
VAQARTLCRRLQAGNAKMRIVIGLWNIEDENANERMRSGCSGIVSTLFSDAVKEVCRLADSPAALESTKEEGKSVDRLPAQA